VLVLVLVLCVGVFFMSWGKGVIIGGKKIKELGILLEKALNASLTSTHHHHGSHILILILIFFFGDLEGRKEYNSG